MSERESELKRLIEQEMTSLHEISGLDKESATQMLMKHLEQEVEHEAAELISRVLGRARDEAEQKAKDILCTAIQRCAVEHTAENVVSTIDLPSDEMKGRIIGREGRNIRAFEKATGVDVIVDDTPGVVVISGFDSVRRELGRRAMEQLVQDGRIHPARIEEVVEKARKDLEEGIQEAGKQASLDTDVRGLMRDQKGVRPPSDHGAEGRIDVPFVAGTQKINLLANRTSGRLHCPNITFGGRAIRIYQHGDARDRRCEFAQQHKPFNFELGLKNTHARHVAAWSTEACHKAECDRVIAASEHDRNRCRHCLGG